MPERVTGQTSRSAPREAATSARRSADSGHTPRANANGVRAPAEIVGRPAVVSPSTPVTVAFPFSTIKIQHGESLVELASLVGRLARATNERGPTAERADIVANVEALTERVRSEH